MVILGSFCFHRRERGDLFVFMMSGGGCIAMVTSTPSRKPSPPPLPLNSPQTFNLLPIISVVSYFPISTQMVKAFDIQRVPLDGWYVLLATLIIMGLSRYS